MPIGVVAQSTSITVKKASTTVAVAPLITITSPTDIGKDLVPVPCDVDVKGTIDASVPDTDTLWLLIYSREGDKPNLVRAYQVSGSDEQWTQKITIGGPQNMGDQFEIVAALADPNAHRDLELAELRRETRREGALPASAADKARRIASVRVIRGPCAYPGIEITAPIAGALVSQTITITVKAPDTLPNDRQLWVLLRPQNGVAARVAKHITVTSEGTSFAYSFHPSLDSSAIYEVIPVLAGPIAQINLVAAQAQGNWGCVDWFAGQWPPDATQCDSIPVVRALPQKGDGEPIETRTATPTNGNGDTPIPPTRTPTPNPNELLVADFEQNNSSNMRNALSYTMGAGPNATEGHASLSFVDDTRIHSRVAEVHYVITGWAFCWLPLANQVGEDRDRDNRPVFQDGSRPDLTDYKQLVFDIVRKGATDPGSIKIELWLNCNGNSETYVTYIEGTDIQTEWSQCEVLFDEFGKGNESGSKIPERCKAEQLVFTVERDKSGQEGTFYLDNIRFVK
jgi:hypothetical protein